MHIYRGKYPKRIESIWITGRELWIRLNDGSLYVYQGLAATVDGAKPKLGSEINPDVLASSWAHMGQSDKRRAG
jgi:hypothetical protein